MGGTERLYINTMTGVVYLAYEPVCMYDVPYERPVFYACNGNATLTIEKPPVSKVYTPPPLHEIGKKLFKQKRCIVFQAIVPRRNRNLHLQ
jgi:hypothetical protein